MTVNIELQPVVTMWIPVVLIRTRRGGGGNNKRHASSVESNTIDTRVRGNDKWNRAKIVVGLIDSHRSLSSPG